MLSPAPDLKGWLARVESFAPQVRAARDEMDRQAQLPLPLLKGHRGDGANRWISWLVYGTRKC